MRITNNNSVIPYLRNLDDIQARKFKEEIRLTTGNKITSLADSPKELVDSKQLQIKMDKNNNYYKVIDDALGELRSASENLDTMGDNLQKVRDLAIDATQIGNQGNTYTLGVYVKGILEDIVRLANDDLNGKFIFSGTKTRPESIDNTPPAKDKMPYELIKEQGSDSNISGYKVLFKGNNNDRIINKDVNSTEVINIKQKEIFGENNEVFQEIINIYNLLSFNSDGSERKINDKISEEDYKKLDDYQQKISTYIEKINRKNTETGARISRFEAIQDQLTNENLRLTELKSIKSDTDVAKTALNLKMEESALQYSLQVGARMMQNSLFDFLG